MQEIITHSYQRCESLKNLPIRRNFSKQSMHDDDVESSRPTTQVRPTAIIVNCNHLLGLDASAIDVLEQVAVHCKQNGCSLIFASVKKSHYRILKRTKLFDSPFPMKDNEKVYPHPTVGYTTGLNDALKLVEDKLLIDADLQSLVVDNNNARQSQFLSSHSEDTLKDFRQCLLNIQNKLSVTIDIQDIMKLAADCIPFHFKRGEPIQVHLSDLVKKKLGRTTTVDKLATIPTTTLSYTDLTDSPSSSDGNSPPMQSRYHSAHKYSKKSLGKNVRGLFFLYKGYVTCSEKSFLHPLDDSIMIASTSPDEKVQKSLPGFNFKRPSFLVSLSRTVSLDAQIRRLELSRSNSEDGKASGDKRVGISQHGPGWVFGKLREGVEYGRGRILAFIVILF